MGNFSSGRNYNCRNYYICRRKAREVYEVYRYTNTSTVSTNVSIKSTTVVKKKLKVVTMSAEHTKNKRKSTYDKYTKPRSVR